MVYLARASTEHPRPAREERWAVRGGATDQPRLRGENHRNLNLLGRCSFTASVPAAGALRPLRDPDTPEVDEDDDGSSQE